MDTQTQVINKFRNQVSHLLKDKFEDSDLYLSKWLRPCNFDIGVAERNLRNSYEWRNVNKINDISKDDMIEVYNEFPMDAAGYDKLGRPLMCLNIAGWELKDFLKQKHGTETFVRYMASKYVEMGHLVKHQFYATSGQVHQFIKILDLQHASMRNLCSTSTISMSIQVVKMIDSHFPEACKAIYVVNAPKYAAILFTAIRPFLSAETKAALKVYDCNKKVWETELLKILELSQLPKSEDVNVLKSP